MQGSAVTAFAFSSVALAVASGCGARTEVSEAAFVGAADTGVLDTATSMDAPEVLCPVAPVSSSPLVVPTFVDAGPFLASSGCSFAATWIGLVGERPVVEAATFRVQAGAWQSTKLRAARGSQNLYNSQITWDGSAYVLGWTDGALFLQTMAEDGTLLGPATRSFSTDDVLVWLVAGEDGELRVGLANLASFQTGNNTADVSFARVLANGTVTLAPTRIIDDAVDFTFAHLPGGSNELLSIAGVDESLFLVSFGDDGGLQKKTLVAPSGGSFSDLLGSGNYVAYLPHESATTVLLHESGSATNVKIPGTYVPRLAATDTGAVGVLASGPTSEDLLLSVVRGTTLESSTRLASDNILTANSYDLAGGRESFGALWTIETGLVFTVLTP